jgi:hypothetical protein
LSRTAGDARWEVMAIVEVSTHSQPATIVPVGTREPSLVYLHGLGEIGGERVEQVEKHGPWEHVRSLEGGYHADARSEIARFHVLGGSGAKSRMLNGQAGGIPAR